MKILIDLGHPAHLHVFRNLVDRLNAAGHEVRLTGRDKDLLPELARELGVEVEFFGTHRKGIANLLGELGHRLWRITGIIRRFRPDVMLAVAGPYISLPGWLLGIPVYVFYDTEHATLSNLLAYPFATCVYVPRCYRKPIRWTHQRYNGYHELAYLHPRYFKANPAVLGELGLEAGEVFSVVRFVSWGAAHDIGRKGFTAENRIRAVKALERFGRVFVSCEGDLPEDLQRNRLKLEVSRIHDLMAQAALVFGESATMASEGAVLGVPGVYVDPVGRGYTDEQEREYGLVFRFNSQRQGEAIEKAVSILCNYDREYWRARGRRLVEEKVDVTELMYRVATERPFTRPARRPEAAVPGRT